MWIIDYLCRIKNTLGTRILELRKQKNWTQSELAAKVKVSYAQIGRYETKVTSFQETGHFRSRE